MGPLSESLMYGEKLLEVSMEHDIKCKVDNTLCHLLAFIVGFFCHRYEVYSIHAIGSCTQKCRKM